MHDKVADKSVWIRRSGDPSAIAIPLREVSGENKASDYRYKYHFL